MAREGARDPLIGTEFGDYRIERRIGRGGMGVVYLAESLRLGRKVALKVLPPDVGDDERYRSRFLRESRLAASLDHPNVVPIYDAGELEGRLFLAMRFVDGTDLAVRLRQGPLGEDQAIPILAGVASALDAAHARGLVHRDVKPANILLAGPSDHPYLADFGLTKLASAGPSGATLGEMVGTPDYVAPEQIRGELVTPAADVYSLGCVAYECLVGEPPFRGTGDLAAVWAHLQKDAPSPSERRDLPAAVDDVLARVLAKDPGERYQTCAAFVGALAEALGMAPPPVPRATRRPTDARTWRSRTRWVAMGAVGLVTVLAGSAVALAPRGGPASTSLPSPPSASSPVAASLSPAVREIEIDAVAFLDAATGSLVDTLHVSGTTTDQATFADGFFWIRGRDPDVLYQIDPDTRSSETIPWGMPSPVWWVVDQGSIWATDPEEPRIVQLDVLTRAQVQAIPITRKDPKAAKDDPIDEVGGVAVGDGSVWVTGLKQADSVVQRYDPQTGDLQEEIRVPYAGLVTFGGGSIWVLARPGELIRIDPASNTVVAGLVLPGRDITYLAFAGGYVWTADPGTGQVWKIDTGGSIAKTFTTGRGGLSVSAAGSTVWVANSRSGTLTSIDATTGQTEQLDVGHFPAAVVAHGSMLMVPVEASAADQIATLQGPVLRVAVEGDPVSPPDPVTNNDFDYRTIAFATCARLLSFRDADAPAGWTMYPEIAAAMPDVSADGRTYTFTIRPGFAFSPPSNAPLTADAVRASLERALDPAAGSRANFYLSDVAGATAYNRGDADHVTGITVTPDGRLSITLDAQAPDFLTRLAAHNQCLVAPGVPAVRGGADPVPMAGPYYVLQHDDKVAILARNPGYRGPRTSAYAYIAIELYRDLGDAIQEVDAGELDVVMMPPDGRFRDLAGQWGPNSEHASAGDQRWYGVPSMSTLFLSLNRTAGPLRDPSIRSAFQLAIDRSAGAEVWHENPIGRLLPGGVPVSGTDVVPMDGSGVETARKLMRGRHVTLRYAYVDSCENCRSFVTAVAPRLASIGITLLAHGVPASTCAGVFCKPGDQASYDVVEGVAQARYPDPWSVLSILPLAMPDTWITDAERDEIARIGKLSGAERSSAAVDFAARFVRDDAALVPISTTNGSAYIGPRVHCRVMQPTLTAVDLANLCP